VGREGAHAECRGPRLAVGGDDGKRGPTGYDAGKKVKGRKRFLVVDTLGLICAAVVCAASVQEIPGAQPVLAQLADRAPGLVKIWADAGYHSRRLIAWTEATLGAALTIVSRAPGQRGFCPLPKRWVVERTFAWLGRYRRLSKDYEQNPQSSTAWLYGAMTHLMLRRLAA
jgi:putative transposase